MSDYIKREDAYEVLTNLYHHQTETQHRALREALNVVPYTDAEPVVRCYECKHIEYEDGLVWMCGRTGAPTGGIEGFCSWAVPEFTEEVRKQLDEWAQGRKANNDKVD